MFLRFVLEDVYVELEAGELLVRNSEGLMGTFKGTYDVLIFLCIVRYLRHFDTSTDILGVFGLACCTSVYARELNAIWSFTFVFHLELDIEQRNDFALPLAHVAISVRARDF